MDELRILVVENASNWQQELPRILKRLGTSTLVHLATTFDNAVEQVTRESYDLAVVDISLTDSFTDSLAPDEEGMQLLSRLHSNPNNHDCGVIILTAYPNSERIKKALRNHLAFDFIEKDKFSNDAFLEAACQAIGDARLRRARRRSAERYRFRISFGRDHLTGSSLGGPGRRMTYWAQERRVFDTVDLARRADNLNLLIVEGGADIWRPEARSIGIAIVDALGSDRRILGDLLAAQAEPERSRDLWIEFSGPVEGLGIPFELLSIEGDFLALTHMMTRRVDSTSFPISRKPESFLKFVEYLVEHREKLRVLLVAANSDENIPAVDRETALIETTIKTSLGQMGILSEIEVLSGDQATLETVVDQLRSNSYHLLHFAGHGRFNDKLPENSGLVLPSRGRPRVLTASDLNLILRDTDLRMVFASACFGARIAQRVGRGDFYGVMEAIARADVPTVVGYRWSVGDLAAMRIAQVYYQALFRTLSPAEALLEARSQAAIGPKGRDDDSWASPVLLMQNG